MIYGVLHMTALYQTRSTLFTTNTQIRIHTAAETALSLALSYRRDYDG